MLLVSRHVNRKESDTTFDYLKINLRIKDNWKFNMNDALIQTFTTLSTDNADELARYEELIPQIIDEIDLISNVNILSIFSMVDQ